MMPAGSAFAGTGAAFGAAGAPGAEGGEGGGTEGLGAVGGNPGRAIPGRLGAEGGRGGGAIGRLSPGGGGAEEEGNGVGAPILVVSFLGMPGGLMRTVSRFTMGASSGFGGSVMRTVSFLGITGLSDDGAEGSSIKFDD